MKNIHTDRIFIAAMSLAIAGALGACDRDGSADAATDTSDTAPVAQADPITPAATPAPEPVTPAVASGDSTMTVMDSDGDGRVTAAEHDAGASTMFTRMDADGNGSVTAAEMEAAKGAAGHDMDNMSSADKIKMIDGNNDGMISSNEHVTGAKAMFEKMDTDSNGSLSASEMQAGHASMGG